MTDQPHTFTGTRGQTEIKGITYAQVYKIVRNKLDWYRHDRSDPDAFCQDMCCQIERLMGIFPNVPEDRSPPSTGASHD